MQTTSKDKLLSQAQKYTQKGQHLLALKTYQEVLSLQGLDPRILLKMAELEQKIGLVTEALQHYTELGAIYQKEHALMKAVAVYKQALQFAPQDVDLHRILADLYQQLHLHQKAIQHYYYLVTLYEKEKNSEKIEIFLQHILTLDPNHVVARLKRVDLYVKQKEYNLAIEDLLDAVKTLKNDHQLIDKDKKILQLLQYAQKLNKKHLEVLSALVDYFLEKGQLREVQENVQILKNEYPKHPLTQRLHLAYLACLDKTTQQMPLPPKLPQGSFLHNKKEPTKQPIANAALDDFDIAIEVDASSLQTPHPEKQKLNDTKHRQEEMTDAFDALLSQFKEGVKKQIDETDHLAHYDLGLAYKEMGLYNDAIEEFQQAQQASQLELNCLMMIGLCQKGANHLEQALQTFTQGLKKASLQKPQEIVFYYEIASVYEKMSRLEDAYKLLQAVYHIDPSFRDTLKKSRDIEATLQQKSTEDNLDFEKLLHDTTEKSR